MAHTDFRWTDEPVAKLTQLYAEGYSASRIAIEIGGITRNSVIGKIQRLKLEKPVKFQPRPVRRVKSIRKQASVKYRPVKQKPDSEPTEATDLPFDESPHAVTLVKLEEHHCRFPIGEPSAMLFCGAEKLDGYSYCGRHCAIAYRPAIARYYPKNWRWP